MFIKIQKILMCIILALLPFYITYILEFERMAIYLTYIMIGIAAFSMANFMFSWKRKTVQDAVLELVESHVKIKTVEASYKGVHNQNKFSIEYKMNWDKEK